MPPERTRNSAALDPGPIHESQIVELVLLASERTEDAFEVDDLVADWLEFEPPEASALLSQDPICER
ncbi:MAG: hypothetical protein P8Q97_10805 [Myxococcota bacterium]|jgi:hypothetical protein|nr:hypothetical protein [Myxococcota bacterium]